jgi:hypothetical protein
VSAFENGDFQSWNNMTISKETNGASEIYISEMMKWGGNASDLFLHRMDLGIKYEIMNVWNYL